MRHVIAYAKSEAELLGTLDVARCVGYEVVSVNVGLEGPHRAVLAAPSRLHRSARGCHLGGTTIDFGPDPGYPGSNVAILDRELEAGDCRQSNGSSCRVNPDGTLIFRSQVMTTDRRVNKEKSVRTDVWHQVISLGLCDGSYPDALGVYLRRPGHGLPGTALTTTTGSTRSISRSLRMSSGSGAVSYAAAFCFFRTAAQRFFCAAAMRARPAADIRRRVRRPGW